MSFPSKMSQKTEVWNSHQVAGHNYFWVVFTVKMGTHFRRQPPGLPLFAHSHTHTLSRRGTVVQPRGLAGSGQVLHHKEHDHTGEQHPTDHEVLVLESSLLDEPHHCVGQAEHIGDVEDLLLGPLGQTRRGRKTKINSFYQGWVNVITRWGFTNRQSPGHA